MSIQVAVEKHMEGLLLIEVDLHKTLKLFAQMSYGECLSHLTRTTEQ